ncbi:MAG: hypothetical protein HY437_02115 [Candidatus Magasanikbacteria bacterium]|nr:hypothetical protein [Candidatus Magasanikbacteria bacterium]
MNDTYYGMYGAFEVPYGMHGAEMNHIDQRELASVQFREPILPRIEETMPFSTPISTGHDMSTRFTLPEPEPFRVERTFEPIVPLRTFEPEPVRFEWEPPRTKFPFWP